MNRGHLIIWINLFFVMIIFTMGCSSPSPEKNITPNASFSIPIEPKSTTVQTPTVCSTPENGSYWIDLDPIENVTWGDTFCVNGTTNIPVGEQLLVTITTNSFTPAGDTRENPTPKIVKITSGNQCDNLISSCFIGSNNSIFDINKEYVIGVSSLDPNRTIYSALKFNFVKNMTIVPFIKIDKIGNHSNGEVFIINGTTNVPVTETLSMDIINSEYMEHPHMKNENTTSIWVSIHNISITFNQSNENRWSVNVTDSVKPLSRGEYLIDVYHKSSIPCEKVGCTTTDALAKQLFILN